MTKNRKKSDTYRFNGVSGIKSVKASELKIWIDQFEAKQTATDDPDDNKWTCRWLKRLQQELAKKERTLEQRQADLTKRLRKTKSMTEFDANQIHDPITM